MMSTPRGALLRLGIVGWLLVGAAACSQQAAEEADRNLPEPGDDETHAREPADQARARELAALYAQEVATAADRLRAEQGDADAQALLAVVHYNGRGVERDYEEAVRWARLAAEQGNARGQSLLGAAYYSGNGVARDPSEAARLLRLAAEQGVASAQAQLGVLYLNGSGVPQDDVSAYVWLTLAVASDSREPGPGRAAQRLAGRMTPEQLAEAEARLRDWNR